MIGNSRPMLESLLKLTVIEGSLDKIPPTAPVMDHRHGWAPHGVATGDGAATVDGRRNHADAEGKGFEIVILI
jgi:hypothetical protein